MNNLLDNCTLCPRKCSVNRVNDELGFCKVGNKVRIARAALHYWEEPCFSGEKGSGTIFFSGCNLKCIFCQNYDISAKNYGYDVSIEKLSDIFINLQKEGAHNINLVTPTPYVCQIIDAIKMAKDKGLTIPIIYNTSGYEEVSTIKLLNGYIDIYMPDLKYYDDTYAQKYSQVKDYFVKATAAIDEMYKQVGKATFDDKGIMTKGVLVRHLILPGLLKDSKEIIRYFSEHYKDICYLSIMNQYTPLEQVKDIPELNKKTTEEEYDELINYALDLGIKNAFIQEGDTCKESFIPKFDGTGIN